MASYKVVFLGLLVIGHEEESRLLKGLQKKFNITPEKAESMLQRVPIVVKKGISKEEADRYVKAFEEIGGKVKVEEEAEDLPRIDITQNDEPKSETNPQRGSEASPTVTRRPEIERRPFKGQMVTCPQCGFEQPETDECVKCGIIISKYRQYQEMAKSVEGQVKEISSVEYNPWESGEGFFQAFYRTLVDTLFSPTQFFRKISSGNGYGPPLVYALITGVIGIGSALFWNWLFMSKMMPMEKLPPGLAIGMLPFFIFLPIWIAIGLFIGSGILHLCLMILGGNKNGYKTTFRAISYSYSGYLFGLIPFIGLLVGGIYSLILTIIGLREGHGISTGKAVLTVLLPTILFIILVIIIVIAVAMFVMSMGMSGVPRT